ncbi:MAG: long-chain fatty acid--CoA ligase [Myxococcales bacterium]|nr:MAG: long-chain fatty acid--CoA ligase [Myxococcales bacterium]
MTETWTLPGQIAKFAAERPDRKALVEMGTDGSWVSTNWAEYWDAVRGLAKALIALGVEPGDGVALIGNNRRDWVISQMGISAAAAVPAPIYVTNTVEQVAYIVKHCKAKVAICDNQAQLDKYLAALDQGLIDVEHIITMDPVQSDRELVTSLWEVIARGSQESDGEVERRMAAAKPDDLALLIYTSGTTGVPKGAMVTHRGIEAMGQSLIETYPEMMQIDPSRYVSYLPLCHVAEQIFTNFVGLRVATETYFCADLAKIKDHLVAARPHLFFAVPRVWEKFEAALTANLLSATGIKAKLAAWARRVELQSFKQSVETGVDVDTFQRRLANKLVISKIKSAIGLDQLLGAGSGAAPAAQSTLEFFASIGIPIHEGFGMTETTGMATANPLGKPRFGTVGQPLPGVEVRIADDGEILLRGANMVSGYLYMPDKSAELWTDDGWLRTGDLGAVDEDGFLSITGRKKDLLITAGGKNVAPAEMENHLQGIPGVGQAVVVGDRQPYLCAILALEEEALPDLCQAAGVPAAPLPEIAVDERVRAFLENRIESDCNAKVARYQTIKKFEVLPHMLSVEGGELTPTMKVKRNVINDKYKAIIDGMYASGASSRPEASQAPPVR